MACLEVIASVHNYPPNDLGQGENSWKKPHSPRGGTHMINWGSKLREQGPFMGHLSTSALSLPPTDELTPLLETSSDSQARKGFGMSPLASPRDSPLLSAAELPPLPSNYLVNDDSIFGQY